MTFDWEVHRHILNDDGDMCIASTRADKNINGILQFSQLGCKHPQKPDQHTAFFLFSKIHTALIRITLT